MKRLENAQNSLKNEVNEANRKKIQKKINDYEKKIAVFKNEEKVIKNNNKKNKKSPRSFDEIREPYKCHKNYMYTNDEISRVLKESVKMYYLNGERSPKKVEVIHSFINCIVAHELRSLDSEIYKDITVISKPVREVKMKGLFHDKNVDITVKYKRHCIGIISAKFIMSSYGKNNVNYMENFIGDCVNLKSIKLKRLFWHTIFAMKDIPSYSKNCDIKNEQLKYKKYDRLKRYVEKDENHKLVPDFISITLLNNIKDFLPIETYKKLNDTNAKSYIETLFDNRKPILDSPDEFFNFFSNLKRFCVKIIEVIQNKYFKNKTYNSLTNSNLSINYE
tara:strand:- start:58 stop:1059 length:1002 start_codon:yes stop_codon:yes gene_type:complete